MKLRTLVAGALLAGFLSAGVPAFVYAQEQRGMGDYDAHHAWHSDSWWYEHHPIGSRRIIRNGLRTAIGMSIIIIGMIATGGKPITPNGRTIITPTGFRL
jgi:hypothetical protein